MQIEINATKRTLQGTGASRRLRRAGKVPGIVYGANQAPLSIELDHNELFHRLKQEAFHASVLTMKLDGEAQQVLLRDYQMHAFRPIVMHVDFQRVAGDQKITMKVPLHFVNAEQAPGVKLQGGIVSHVLNEVNISCLPADLPEFIEVDLKELAAGKSIHMSELKMPKGVEPALHRGEDPVVATMLLPKGAAAEEAEAAEAAAAAPAAAPAAAAGKQAEKK